MNLTLSIPYSDLIIRGRYLPAECETSDKPRVPECYEVESVQWWKELEWIARFEIIELVDHLTPESLTEIERRKLDEIRQAMADSKAEDAA